MKATEKTFSEILGLNYPMAHYHVPKFQREYEWSRPQWEQLYDDISSNDPGHFLGSIICIGKSANEGGDEIFELVDGQQRLTSLCLLQAAIHRQIFKGDSELSGISKESVQYIDLRRRLAVESADSGSEGIHNGRTGMLLRVQPSTQNENLNDYMHIMSHCGVWSQRESSPNYGNRRMAKAYQYFQNRVLQDQEMIKALLNRINALQMVHIGVGSHADAFRLFETLNNRGLVLSAIDIIKNQMLAAMEKKGISIEDAYNQWQRLLVSIEEHEDRFLRQFYNAFKHCPKIEVDKYRGKVTQSTLIRVYDALIGRDPKFIFDELEEKGKIYRTFIFPDEDAEIGRELIELERIGAAASYALLLYLRSVNSADFADEGALVDIVRFLKKYYVRRNITDQPPTRDLDQLQIDTIAVCEEMIRDGKRISAKSVADAMMRGRGKPAPQQEFAERLKDSLFSQNEQMARYLLRVLNGLAKDRQSPDLWKKDRANKGKFVWTVEHILPQGKNLRQEWVNMIGQGDREQAREIQDKHVHCLGNLTMSGYNARLSDREFAQKQEKSEMSSGGFKIPIGYKHGLPLNNLMFPMNGQQYCLADIPVWTEDSIIARNEEMVRQLLEHYKFDGE